MRVDLGLQRLQLHARGQFGLLLDHRQGELRGQKGRETFRHGRLVLVDAPRRGVVELQRAHDRVVHGQGSYDGRLDARVLAHEADGLGRLHDARLAVAEHVARDLGLDGRANEVVFRVLACKAQNLLAAGDGHRDGRDMRQQQVAHGLGRGVVEAFDHVGDGAAG